MVESKLKQQSQNGSSSNRNTQSRNENHQQQSQSTSEQTKAASYTPEQAEIVKKILSKKDYYDILGVEKNSKEDAIKRAYKKLAVKLHPDKNNAPKS